MKLYVFLFVVSALLMSSSAGNVGGIGDDEKVAGDAQKEIIKKLAPELKTQALATLVGSNGSDKKKDFDKSEIEIVSYKTQVVAGTNYFFKLRMANMIFHARVYEDLKGNVSVSKVVGPKEESEEIKYIE